MNNSSISAFKNTAILNAKLSFEIEIMTEHTRKAYVVAVDMGYGHQRAAYPLIDIAAVPEAWHFGKPMIISANSYPGIPYNDRFTWQSTRKFYETVSRMKGFPLLGKQLFNVMDYLERIESFYPKRDLSKAPFKLKYLYRLIKNGFGKHLIDELNKNPLPFVTSFFIPAFFAEQHGYKGEIYCICTDTDISRVWAPLHPEKSRITYLVPNYRVKERLKQYGVNKDKIFVTGFPLPKETLGDEKDLSVARESLRRRIALLDPRGRYQRNYQGILSMYLGQTVTENKKPLTITFAVGGAGAQATIGISMLKSLREKIKEGTVKINLVAGSSNHVRRMFEHALVRLRLDSYKGTNVQIIYDPDKYEYFKKFNHELISTDILWTKPSELSFYAGMGLPIIIAPPLGAQEDCNKAWIYSIGAGFDQDNPKYTHEWLFDWLQSGWLAEAAMNGFMDAPKRGTYHIEDLILRGKVSEIEDVHFL